MHSLPACSSLVQSSSSSDTSSSHPFLVQLLHLLSGCNERINSSRCEVAAASAVARFDRSTFTVVRCTVYFLTTYITNTVVSIFSAMITTTTTTTTTTTAEAVATIPRLLRLLKWCACSPSLERSVCRW